MPECGARNKNNVVSCAPALHRRAPACGSTMPFLRLARRAKSSMATDFICHERTVFFGRARRFFRAGATRAHATSLELVIAKIAGDGDAPWEGMHHDLRSGMHAAGQRWCKESSG